MKSATTTLGQRLNGLSDDEIAEVLRSYSHWDRRAALRSWYARGRPQQLPPAGEWRTWLIMAGRGFGKTRTGAEWVRIIAYQNPGACIAIVGATLHEARGIMVEGESGLLSVGRPKERPRYEPSIRRLTWPNGTLGYLYSAEDPDALRGAQHSHAWGDEIAKWPRGVETWMNMQMGLRLGRSPRALLTTTPRPTALIKVLINDASVIVQQGRTADNITNLAPAFVEAITAAYGGTRLGRQELDGELIEDVEGALWTRALIERCRVATSLASARDERDYKYTRVVIGVDPPAGEGASAAACGIVVVGLRADGTAVVIDDASVQGLPPEGWARAVVSAADRHGADRVIAEVNNGGSMVTSVLRAVDSALPVKAVRASRGKVARAEPVATLYERGRVKHAGAFPALEDEMCGLIAGGVYAGPGGSPDRADALVWALSELMLKKRWWPGVRSV